MKELFVMCVIAIIDASIVVPFYNQVSDGKNKKMRCLLKLIAWTFAFLFQIIVSMAMFVLMGVL